MITLTFTGENPEDLKKQLAEAVASFGGKVVALADKPVKEKTGDGKRTDTEVIDVETVRKLAAAKVKEGKTDEIKKLLKDEFDTEGLSKLDPKHFAKFYPLLKAL